MNSLYIIALVSSFAITLACLWGFCRLAPYVGLIDHPLGRKAHEKSTPLIGGLAIGAGVALTLTVSLSLMGFGPGFIHTLSEHRGFLAGIVLLAAIGAADDRRPIPARYKLIAQILACSLAVFLDKAVIGDVDIDIGPSVLFMGPLVWPFTILVMLTITNAINMIDGIDGLAGGITFVILLVMSKAIITAGFGSGPYLLAAVGATAAFLMFNFPWRPGHRAMAFLGDSGSLVCGFALAYLAIVFSSLPNRVFKPSTALWFFLLPVADTVWLYLRRLVVARAPFMAGRDHIHHLLMRRFTPGQTAWLLVGATGLTAGGAYLASRLGAQSLPIILAWIIAFLAYGAVTQKPWREAWERGKANGEHAIELKMANDPSA